MTVRISSVDLASRHLDLEIIEMPERTESPAARPSRAATGPREKGRRKGYKKGRRGRRG